MLKYDPHERVQVQAAQIWKNIVDNPLLILKQVIQTMITLIYNII